MNRVLATPHLSGDARHLTAPDRRIDASTRALVDQLEAEAYRRGHADGERTAVAAAAAAAERATAALRPLLDAVASGLDRLRDERVRADVDLAMGIAEHVLGVVPPVDVRTLAARVHGAVAQLADEDLEVRVHPAQAEALDTALAARGGGRVRVTADPAVASGEAVVAGRWARADLTRDAALAAVRELLAEPAGADHD